jgi:hypothetical protein
MRLDGVLLCELMREIVLSTSDRLGKKIKVEWEGENLTMHVRKPNKPFKFYESDHWEFFKVENNCIVLNSDGLRKNRQIILTQDPQQTKMEKFVN